MPHHRRSRLLVLSIVALPLVALSWFIGDTFIEDDNFRVVTAAVFRAGQMRADEWQEDMAEHPFRSVLNLRGANEGRPWYDLERSVAAANRLTHYDVGLSANVAPSLDQMRQLVGLMRAAPKPLLIHCKDGADRTGLVAALYLYAIDGVSPAVADRQLSLWYGHFPWYPSATGAMDSAFASYVAANPPT